MSQKIDQFRFSLAVAAIVVSLLVISYLQYIARYKPDPEKVEKNLVNIQKIRSGMDTSAVISIMGKPDSRYIMNGSTAFYYLGTLPLDCHIIFDPNGKVIKYFPTAEEIKKFRKLGD